MGSTIGQRIDYNGVGALERPAAHTQQNLTQVTPRVLLHADCVTSWDDCFMLSAVRYPFLLVTFLKLFLYTQSVVRVLISVRSF